MMRAGVVLFVVVYTVTSQAATKAHAVALGKWSGISSPAADGQGKNAIVKMRPLYVDGRAREFTVGDVHDVTEHTFVVQRVYKLNDSLPQEGGPPQWRWQLGGWLLVDRVSAKIQSIALPEYDPDSSRVSWFRDYAAYCGISDDGQKLYAMIVQLGHRKPLLRKTIGDGNDSSVPCAPPRWERHPVRATFETKPDQKLAFAVKSRAIEVVPDDEDDDSGSQ